jgi:hypothetical protein
MNTIVRSICYIAAAIIVAATICFFILPEPGLRPIAKTKAIIELVVFEIKMHENLNKGSFFQLPSETTNSIQMNRVVGTWVAADTNVVGKVNLNPDGLLVDTWGTPLNFELRSKQNLQISGELLKQAIEGETNGLLVWSSGPNRTNEYGSGDDVFPTDVFYLYRP